MNTNYRLNIKGDTGIILTHGLLSNINSNSIKCIEKVFSDNNITTLSFDIFGNGQTYGKIEDLTLTICYEQIKNMYNILKDNGISCNYLYGTSFSSLPIIRFGNELDTIETIFLKTPIFDYRKKREKEFSKEKMEKWMEKGIIEIIKSIDGIPAVYQKYNFLEDYDSNFSLTFLKNKKILFTGAGILDNEIDIEELHLLYMKGQIILKEYNSGHRFSKENLFDFCEDIADYLKATKVAR